MDKLKTWVLAFSAIIFLSSSFQALAEKNETSKTRADKPMYFLYGDPKPGTKFKQKLYESNVPFDLRYREMSSTLQARVKDAYGGLKDSETPPFPTEGMQAIYRPLYKANRALDDEGDVLAIAMVDAAGKVESVSMYKSPTDNVASMVNYILVNTKFDPATCDGTPCKMEFLFETRLEVKPAWTR